MGHSHEGSIARSLGALFPGWSSGGDLSKALDKLHKIEYADKDMERERMGDP